MLTTAVLASFALIVQALPAPQAIEPIEVHQKSTSTVTDCPEKGGKNCTKIEWQDGIINWGNTKPVDTIGFLLRDPDGLCSNSKYQSSCTSDQSAKQKIPTTLIKSQFRDADVFKGDVGEEEPGETVMTVVANDMPNEDVKKNIITTIQAAIGHFTDRKEATARSAWRVQDKYNYKFDQFFAPNYIKILFQPDDDPKNHFHLELKIEQGDMQAGQCEKVAALGSSVVGAMAGFLGPFAVIASAMNIVGNFAC